ncbi:MAG: diguanylate cyclase [Planctomycetota bacterium]
MAGIKILLAEDNCDHRRLLMLALGEGKVAVDIVTASCRDELLVAAESTSFDCMILDYNLPPHTAPELIGELQALQRDVPVIVVSSSQEQQIVIEALRTGVSDFVHKTSAMDAEKLWWSIDDAIQKAERLRDDQRRMNRRLLALQRQAETDPLTSLFNRRFLEDALEQAASRSDRRQSVSITFVDLDHFKRVNDTLGHGTGDDVLRETAMVLRNSASPSDLVVRWGGEEFVIVRQSDSICESWIWADRLRRQIAQGVTSAESVGPVTASIGVHVVPTCDLNGGAIDDADRAMYLAKESGRDRVCTREMARAVDAALRLRLHRRLSPRERMTRLIEQLDSDLGMTQREHVGQHGRDVRDLCMKIASMTINGSKRRSHLELASEFHDVGKLGVPEELLGFSGHFDTDQRSFVDQHAWFGSRVMRICGSDEEAVDAVKGHHDRYDDGNAGMIGEPKPPSLASVISACDAVAAMTSDRPYSKSRTMAEALSELKKERGRQFHPVIVDALLSANQDRRLAAA